MNKSYKKLILYVGTLVLVVLVFDFGIPGYLRYLQVMKEREHAAQIAATIGSVFTYRFAVDGVLEEASELYKSTSPYWWLNSGGLFYIDDGTGRTIQGSLLEKNKWRTLYNKNNPEDTDRGYKPQNLFRLITRGTWHNFEEQVFFKISKYNLSESANRNESNGVLLLGRYEDGDNLYYVGLRVDGTAVIKKKLHGTYYTLAQKQIFPGTYDIIQNPNLLPLEKWIGLKAKIFNASENMTYLELYTDVGRTGEWKLVLDVLDNGTYGVIVNKKSSAGLRSDFMDISFASYKIEEL